MAFWDRLGTNGNVEDRRGLGGAVGGLGLGGLALVVALNFLGGGDFSTLLPTLLKQLGQVQSATSYNAADFEGADSYEVFASTVLGSNDQMWERIFAENSLTYEPPTLVLFRGATPSSCGGADADVGPHYCPTDRTIYLDETFFDELEARFGATGGDVAEAYVIAHEVGHHVQHLLGVSDQVARSRSNDASIRLELQADCYAGLWVNSIRDLGVFEPGEVREAIDAAATVGDDRIQRTTTGRVNPETWTHGSSAERVQWFTTGYETGSVKACDTFN